MSIVYRNTNAGTLQFVVPKEDLDKVFELLEKNYIGGATDSLIAIRIEDDTAYVGTPAHLYDGNVLIDMARLCTIE